MSLDGVIRLARLGFIELFRTDEHGRDIVVRMALYDFGMFRFFVPIDGYLAVCRIFFDQFSQGFFSALAIGAAIEIKSSNILQENRLLSGNRQRLLMTPAAMCTTVVFTMVMLVVVVAASYVRIEFQRSVEQFFDGIISTARDTAIEVDRGFCQALFGSAADTAGNDSIDFLGLQESD